MKILYVSGYTRMILFNKLIPRALRSAGAEVAEFDWNSVYKFNKFLRIFPAEKIKNEINRRLLAEAKSVKPDFIFVLKGEPIARETLSELKSQTKAKLFNWFGDDPWEFPVFSGPVSLYYDYFFTYDPYSVDLYKKIGMKNAYHLPYGYDENLGESVRADKKDCKKYSCDVAFIGSHNAEREELLKSIKRRWDLKIWGRGWKNSSCQDVYQGKALYGVEMLKAMKCAKILLNIHNGFTKGIQAGGKGLNLRVMEGAATGAFQISNLQEDIPRRFVPGKEIELYTSWEEAVEKIEYYLQKPDERKSIGKAAFERLKKEHTLKQRMEEIFEIITGS